MLHKGRVGLNPLGNSRGRSRLADLVVRPFLLSIVGQADKVFADQALDEGVTC
jgi:hypothetical protein